MKRLKIVAESSVPYIQGVAEELGEVTYLPSEEFAPGGGEGGGLADYSEYHEVRSSASGALSGAADHLGDDRF